MHKEVLTDKNKTYIKRNRLKISSKQMAKKIGCSASVVQRFLRKNGLQVSKALSISFRAKALTGRTTSTPQIDKFLKKEYLNLPVNQLSKRVNKSENFIYRRLQQLHLKRPKELIKKFTLESRIKPGAIPPNKGKKMPANIYEKCKGTMFKKGQTPHNARGFKNGDIKIHWEKLKDGTKRPYKWIRISKGKWRMLHVHNWIKKHGPVPEGHIIVFKDKNTINCDPENLEYITLKENMKRNSIHNYPDEIKSAVIKLGKLNKKIRYAEKQIE